VRMGEWKERNAGGGRMGFLSLEQQERGDIVAEEIEIDLISSLKKGFTVAGGDKLLLKEEGEKVHKGK